MTFHIHELHQKTKREILEVWEVAKEHMDDQDKKIEQLEKEKLESIDAWNSQLEKASARVKELEQENKRLKEYEDVYRQRQQIIEEQLARGDRLEQENKELKEWQRGVYALSCYLVFHESNNDIVMGDAKAALAQHDREVAVKAIDDFVDTLTFFEDLQFDDTYYVDGVAVHTLNEFRSEYLEQLKEGEQ